MAGVRQLQSELEVIYTAMKSGSCLSPNIFCLAEHQLLIERYIISKDMLSTNSRFVCHNTQSDHTFGLRKGEQLVKYYGYYSNRARGDRRKEDCPVYSE